MHKQLIKNSKITLIALFFVGITQLIFNVAIARFFNPTILGEVNLALSTAILFSVIVSSGLNPANNKFVAEYLGRKKQEKIKHIFSFSLFTTIIFSILITIILILLKENIMNLFNITSYYLISLPIILLYSLYLLLKGMFYGTNQIKDYFKIEIISRIIFFISLMFVIITKSYFLLPFIVIYLLFVMLSLPKLKEYITFNFKDKIIKKVIKYAVIAFVGTFSSLARTRLSIIIPAIFLAKSEIGLFSVAFSLLTLFYFLLRAITLVMTPLISFKYGEDNKKDILNVLNLSNKYLTLCTILFSALTIILSKFILGLLFGQEYLVATTTLQILSLSALFTVIATPSVNTLSATKYVHIPSITGVLGLVLSILSWILLVPRYHLVGIAIGFLIGSVVNALIPIYYAKKHFKPRSTLNLIIKGVLSFLVAIIFINIPLFSASIFTLIYIILNKRDITTFILKIKEYNVGGIN